MVATLLILIYVIDTVLKMYKTTLTRNNVDGNENRQKVKHLRYITKDYIQDL